MCDLGFTPESFNPRILYVLKRAFNYENHPEGHSHDFVSLIYIVSGACTYNINGILYEVRKGDIIVCNPGVNHSKIIGPGEDVVEFHIGLNNICRDGLTKDCLIPPDASPVTRLTRYEQDVGRCCSEMLAEQEKNEPGNGLMLKALAMKLIIIYLKATWKEQERCEESPLDFESYDKVNIVNTIVSFINDNYMKDISLDKISRNMYLSPVYISKIFREEMGDSPINYLIKVRLSKALELLGTQNITVKAAAKSVGYDDAYHFSKLFKKHYGTSPSRYKRNSTLQGETK